LNRSSSTNQPAPCSSDPAVEVANFDQDDSNPNSVGVLEYHTSDMSLSVTKCATVQIAPQFHILKGVDSLTNATFYGWLRLKKRKECEYVDIPNSSALVTFTRATDSVVLPIISNVDMEPGDRLQVIVASTDPTKIHTAATQNTVGKTVVPFTPAIILSAIAFGR